MRARSLRPVTVRALLRWSLLTVPWLVLHCGSSNDLVIGRVDRETGGATTSGSSGSAGADAATGGIVVGGSGMGGADTVDAGVSGMAGQPAGGAGPELCEAGDVPAMGSLVHRYSFDGTGTAIVDSVSAANGLLVGGTTLDGSGMLTLDGTDDYVDLPNGMISLLTDATFVTWTQWDGGAGYERIFDFGTSTLGEDQREQGETYIALIPFTGRAEGRELAVQINSELEGEETLATAVELPQGEIHLLSVVFHSRVLIELYLDTQLIGTLPTGMALADITDNNNWLGQSQWTDDHTYNGAYDEFRIYDVALDRCQIETLFQAGADGLP